VDAETGERSGDLALAEGDDELLREHADWALARIAERAE
jgi:hypothetical protein